MPYLYLVIAIFMNSATSVFGRLFQIRADGYKDSDSLYNFTHMVSACACWTIYFAVDFSFDSGVLLYSALFAICYTCCNVCFMYALRLGSTTLSALFLNLALVSTTVWGFIFWSSVITSYVIVGLAMVVAAIYLCLYKKRGVAEKSFSWKWLICAICAMLGNSGCSIVQRTQQLKFNGAYAGMLMFFASLLSAAVCFFFLLKERHGQTLVVFRRTWWIPVIKGICNFGLNLFVILLALTDLSPSLIYPCLGVGALMIVTFVAQFIFKEKLKILQWIGLAVGSVAIVLLSI